MAFVLADRVRETSTTTGTGTYTLAGAVAGFRTFSSGIGANDTAYVATMGTQWEVGLGAVSGASLARTVIRASSNAGAAVNWTAGTKDIRCDADAFYLLGTKPVLSGPTSLSGTSFDFTGVPAAATKLEIFIEIRSNGSSDLILRLGDAGGLESDNTYVGHVQQITFDDFNVDVSQVDYTTTFIICSDIRSSTLTGRLVLDRISGSINRWMLTGMLLYPNLINFNIIGTKTLSATLTQFRITRVNGTDTFASPSTVSVRTWT